MELGEQLWWSRTKTVLVVISITLLIWLAADQNVTEEEDFQVTVQLVSERPDRYVGFAIPPYNRTFTVKLRGRRNRLQDFGKILEGGTPVDAVITPKPISPEPRSITVMTEILGNIKALQESRLTIQSVDPESVDVIIDKYETIKDVRVKPDYGDLKVTPEFLRSAVSVTIPRFVRRILGDAPIATAVPNQSIRAVSRPDGNFEVGGLLDFDLPEKLDPKLRIEFSPSREVMISGRIEALTATESKGPIQIYWSMPDEVQKDFVVVTDQMSFRVHIDVTGPKDRLSQLDPRRIRAFIDVLAGDMDNPGAGKEIVRDVRFVLPSDFPDCTIATESQTYQARFRLEPRPRGASTASPGAQPVE